MIVEEKVPRKSEKIVLQEIYIAGSIVRWAICLEKCTLDCALEKPEVVHVHYQMSPCAHHKDEATHMISQRSLEKLVLLKRLSILLVKSLLNRERRLKETMKNLNRRISSVCKKMAMILSEDCVKDTKERHACI